MYSPLALFNSKITRNIIFSERSKTVQCERGLSHGTNRISTQVAVGHISRAAQRPKFKIPLPVHLSPTYRIYRVCQKFLTNFDAMWLYQPLLYRVNTRSPATAGIANRPLLFLEHRIPMPELFTVRRFTRVLEAGKYGCPY